MSAAQADPPRVIDPKEATEETPRFDTILERLETLVAKLEDANLPLEDSLAAFERGISLSRQGQRILDDAERKIEVLLHDASTRDLDPPIP